MCIVSRSFLRPAQREGQLALALAAIAGFVDAVCFITLHHLFVAHMTGNASKLGVALAHGRLGDALPLVLAPVLYVLGIAAGTAAIELRSRRPVLVAQAALIAGYMGYGSTVIHGEVGPDNAHAAFYVLEVLAVVAFGLQTAALTEIAGAPIRTTYVSGPLTTMTVTAVRRALGRKTPEQWLLLVVGIWIAYVVFATAGAFGLRELSVWCLAFPLAALLALSAALG